MLKRQARKWRIAASRIFVTLVIMLIMISQSKWEQLCPLATSILFFVGVILVGIASLGRLWCSLYIAGHKNTNLITAGPYSMSRNPLYFFSLIGAVGVGLATETLLIALLLGIGFALYYPFVIAYEEQKLQARYAEKYAEYARTVPRFIPKLSILKEPDEWVVDPVTFRRHIFSALWFVWLVGAAELVEEFHELGYLPVVFTIP
ncbi:MAG: isoprenylcysteine carboxylmethyltransferase family protein [Planctomycetes bacterium]|nr:isoprenylcysteine carboxylmethyltransferase family protein [Planctomycetota bacterium]